MSKRPRTLSIDPNRPSWERQTGESKQNHDRMLAYRALDKRTVPAFVTAVKDTPLECGPDRAQDLKTASHWDRRCGDYDAWEQRHEDAEHARAVRSQARTLSKFSYMMAAQAAQRIIPGMDQLRPAEQLRAFEIGARTFGALNGAGGGRQSDAEADASAALAQAEDAALGRDENLLGELVDSLRAEITREHQDQGAPRLALPPARHGDEHQDHGEGDG